MHSTKITQSEARYSTIIQHIRARQGVPTYWLPTSYVMAHVQIESGFDPTIRGADYATTGSEGLMQVSQAALDTVESNFPQVIDLLSKGQLDPFTSLLTGMLYLRFCYDYLTPIFLRPLLYKHVCAAYNAGPRAVAGGFTDSAYYYKWLSAQRGWAFLDEGFVYQG